MGNDLTPTQRKQVCRKTTQVGLPLPSANEPILTPTENESTEDQFWYKWEAEARQLDLTPDGWQSFMAEKALDLMQNIDPGTIHAKYGGKPSPRNAELLKKLLESEKDG